MPTYVYRREDGSTFEIDQRITEDALETCPETGQKVERIITGSAGLIFKGSGFYLTDYARNNNSSESKSSSTSGESPGSEGSASEGTASGGKASSGESSGANTSSGGSSDGSSGSNASSNS
ncbi:MAG: FmdB family zinc ribbon protein [Rhodothermales bacterium]